MATDLTRREAALLGFMLRFVHETAGDALTGERLPDLLKLWKYTATPDLYKEQVLLTRRVIALVRALPPEYRDALVQQRCRLRPLDNDRLRLELVDGPPHAAD